MNRYRMDQGEYRVTVGWCRRLATFTLAVQSLKALRELERLEQMWLDMAIQMRGYDSLIDQIAAAEVDTGPIFTRGTTQGEITKTAQLYRLAMPYADIPSEIMARLIYDSMREPAQLSHLDRFIQRLTANAARRSADRS